MSIIIRLQRLSWSASAADVREFFRGLIIPEGGVHIVGGRDGDAFIAFSSDEDARLAMRQDGKRLKEQKIKLLLSSRQEMQKVIEKARGDFASSQHEPSVDDDGSRRKRRLSVSRSRSGSRERETRSNFNHSRSRSPDRLRGDKEIFSQNPQKPSVPISGFSSFPSSFKQQIGGVQPPMIPFDQNLSMPTDANLGGFLDRVPPSMPPFNKMSGMLDRNNMDQTRNNQTNLNFDPTMMNERKFQNYQSPQDSMNQKNFPQIPMMLNEMAFTPSGTPTTMASSQKIDFDGRGPPNFQQFSANNKNNQQDSFTASTSIVPIVQPPIIPIRNRRALLPEPDEIQMAPDVNDSSSASPFFRNSVRTEDIMYKAMMDRQQQPDFRNVPDVQMYQNDPGIYPNTRDAEPFYRPPPIVDAFDASMNVPYGNHLDRDSSSFGYAICIDNVPPKMFRYGEVRYFFHPMRLDGPDSIKIIVDEHGQKTGRIYCRFSTATDLEAALCMDRRDNVRIRPCTDAEYDSAVDGVRSMDFNKRSSSWKDDSNSKPSSDRYHSSASYYQERTERSNSLPWDVVDGRYIVELSNIPYKTDDKTVWDVVSDLRPVSLRRKMKIQNNIVLQSDTAFVEFNNESDADAVLTYGGRHIGGRPVNIRKCSVRVMEELDTRFFNPNGRRSPQYSRDYRDRDRDRNPRDRERDHDSRDRDYDRDRDRGRSRDADVRDDREKDRDREKRPEKERSVEKKDRSKDREKERSHSSTVSPQQNERSTNDRSKISNASSSSSTPVEKHTCIMMSGLPPNIQSRDIVSFFQGLRFAHGGIRLMREPRGTAYVEFCSTRDCEQAMLKNREYIGVQVVTLRTCSKAELTEAVQKQHGIGQQQQTSGVEPSKPSDESNSQPILNKTKPENVPMVEQTSTNYNSNLQMRSTKKDEPTTSSDQKFNRASTTNASQRSAILANNVKPTAHIVPNAQQQQNNNKMTPGGQQNQILNPAMLNIHEPPSSIAAQPRVPDLDNSVVGDLGLSGFVCFLHNLPPKVTLEEICALFQNEQMIDDSVRMHYSSNTGEPTGDCLLAFATKQDADRACAKTNGKTFFGRSLQMWTVPQNG